MKKMDDGFERRIQDYVVIFNTTANNIIRMRALQVLLELSSLESIIIFEFANCKPRSSFKEEVAHNHMYARVAINNETPYVVVEQKRDGEWQLKKLIPLKRIASIKVEVMGTDKTRFRIFMTVVDLLDIETPSFITF